MAGASTWQFDSLWLKYWQGHRSPLCLPSMRFHIVIINGRCESKYKHFLINVAKNISYLLELIWSIVCLFMNAFNQTATGGDLAPPYSRALLLLTKEF